MLEVRQPDVLSSQCGQMSVMADFCLEIIHDFSPVPVILDRRPGEPMPALFAWQRAPQTDCNLFLCSLSVKATSDNIIPH